MQRAYARAQGGEFLAARSDLEKAIALDRNNFAAHNNYAWLLATCPDPRVRDGKRALEFARGINQRAGKQSAMILDTLAAAEAAAGDFHSAVNDAKRAMSIDKGQGGRATYQQHLDSYLKSNPVREIPGQTSGSKS